MADDDGHPGRARTAPGPPELHLTRRHALDWLLAAGSSALLAACAPEATSAGGPHPRPPVRYLAAHTSTRPGAATPSPSASAPAPSPSAGVTSAAPPSPTAPPTTPAPSPSTPAGAPPSTPPPAPGGSALVDPPDVGRLRHFVPGAPAGAIALTIDDGPTPQWTPLVLDLLERLGITATFCVVGQQAAEQPRLVRRIAAAGHTVVNHSLTHPLRVPALSTAQLVQEVTRPQQILGDLLGRAPTLFRSPGGEWTPDLLAVLDDTGLSPLGWNVDPRDWSRPGVAVIESRVLAAAAGDIVLCHDGGGDRSETVQALTDVLPRLRARGLRFVPL